MKYILFINLFLLEANFSAAQSNQIVPASKFLNSLNIEQLKTAQLNFNDKAKYDWHFVPAASYPRTGIALNQLNEEQKKLLFEVLQSSLSETGYAKTQQIISLENVLAEMKELNHSQQSILLQLIGEYLATMPEDLAAKRMEKLKKEEAAEILFGWAGATKLGEGHYYRIQGKSFLIEFDNTQNNANHIHSVWRDFDGDFGRDLIRGHYQSSEHHH
jgi:hypothetical protein